MHPHLLTRAADLKREWPDEPQWCWTEFAGRLSEISNASSTATLTMACLLLADAQRQGEPSAWITLCLDHFFPPDFAANGVDIEALTLVKAPDPIAAARAAERLTRSGGFGLLIIELGAQTQLPLAALGRLLKLALSKETAIVFLTAKRRDQPSLGSVVSMRAHTARCDLGRGKFLCEAHVVKDKIRGPGLIYRVECDGPSGLR